MSIPKVIHYCWFGKGKMPPLAEKCIKSWKKYCPDYEIIEWNEGNFDISSCPLYVRQAYEARKWAFVTDYVRLKVVYDHGGIYMDTDVELLKAPEKFLSYSAYFGFEDGVHVATGLGFGAEKEHPLLEELMADYEEISFVCADGSFDTEPCPVRNTKVFLRHGLKQDDSKQILDNEVCILPSIYLCPLSYQTGNLCRSPETVSIHWFDASWQSKSEKEAHQKRLQAEKRDKLIHLPNRILMKLLGNTRYQRLKQKLKRKK